MLVGCHAAQGNFAVAHPLPEKEWRVTLQLTYDEWPLALPNNLQLATGNWQLATGY